MFNIQVLDITQDNYEVVNLDNVEVELPDPLGLNPQKQNTPTDFHILSPLIENTQRLSPQKEKTPTPTAPLLLSASMANTQPAPQRPSTRKEKSPIRCRRSTALHSNNKRVSKVDTMYIGIY